MKSSKSVLSIRELLLGIWLHLRRRRKIQIVAAFMLMLASGLCEVISLAAVIPFLALLTNPDPLFELPLFNSLASILDLDNSKNLLIPASLVFAITAVLAASIRILSLWINKRLASSIGSDLSFEAYRRTLYQPYSVHVKRNSSVILSAITTKSEQTVFMLNSTLQLGTGIFVAFAIIVALLAFNWFVYINSILLFGACYLFLSLIVRKKLDLNSKLVDRCF